VVAPWQVLAIRFADRVGKGLRAAPRDALLAESAPATQRGAAFGLHRASDHAGAVLGPLLASALLLLLPGRLRWIFLLALLPGVVSVLVIVLRVREVPAAAPAPPAVAPLRASVAIREGFRGPLARLLLVIGLFTLGNATDAFLLLRAQELGVPLALIPLLWAVHHVSKMLWNVVGGGLADRLGAVPAIVAGWTVYALTYAGFAFAGSAWHAWALFVGYGLFYGLTEAPEKVLVAQLAPGGRRGSSFGAYHFAIGIAALPASVIFGVIWGAAGPRAAFLFGAGVAALAAVLLALLRLPRAPLSA
jgi:MFS family permease